MMSLSKSINIRNINMNIDKSVNVYTYCTTNFLLITTNFEFQGDFKPLREWLRTNVHEIGEMKYFH